MVVFFVDLCDGVDFDICVGGFAIVFAEEGVFEAFELDSE